MVDFIPGMALIHLTKGTESLGSGDARHATDGRSPRYARRSRGSDSRRGGAGADSGSRARRSSAEPAPETGPSAPGHAAGPDVGPAAGERSEPTTCGFCGKPFVEDRSQATCQACPLSKGCGLMRCPHCGYENAKEPGWLSRIKEWIR